MSDRHLARIAFLIMLGAGMFAWREHHRAESLQKQLAALPQSSALSGALPAKTPPHTQVQSHQPDEAGVNSELLRLRGEVTRLRAEAAADTPRTTKVEPAPLWDAKDENFRDGLPEAGVATPHAALQTFLSRTLSGKIDEFQNLVVDMEEQADSAQILGEHLASHASMSADQVKNLESIRIVDTRLSPEGDTRFLVLMQFKRDGGFANWVTLKQTPDGYKLGVWIVNRGSDGVSLDWNKPSRQ